MKYTFVTSSRPCFVLHCLVYIRIGCDVLEKDEDVVGRGSAELEGGAMVHPNVFHHRTHVPTGRTATPENSQDSHLHKSTKMAPTDLILAALESLRLGDCGKIRCIEQAASRPVADHDEVEVNCRKLNTLLLPHR